MNTGIVHGSNGGNSISFLSAPSALPADAQRLEPKICETCGNGFYRPVQHAKAHGPKTCRRCLALPGAANA